MIRPYYEPDFSEHGGKATAERVDESVRAPPAVPSMSPPPRLRVDISPTNHAHTLPHAIEPSPRASESDCALPALRQRAPPTPVPVRVDIQPSPRAVAAERDEKHCSPPPQHQSLHFAWPPHARRRSADSADDDTESCASRASTHSAHSSATSGGAPVRGYPPFALRFASPLLDALPTVVDLEGGSCGKLVPEHVPTAVELESQKAWFDSLRLWVCLLMAVANVGLFLLFTPSILNIGTDGFRWALLYVMLPWLGIKFLVAMYAFCVRKKLNKMVSFTSAGTGGAAASAALEPTLCVFVPVWRENETQLRRTLLSVRNGYYSKERVSIMVVIDECAPDVALNCLQILFGPERAHWMHAEKRRAFRWFTFSGETRPYYVAEGVTDEGVHAMVFMKYANKRKWDSICFFFLLHRYLTRAAPSLTAAYLLCVDSDTQLVETETSQSMRQMVTRFEQMPRVLAACGETCVANIDSGVISKSQVWEYFASFNCDKMFESHFGRVVCLPGCMTAFRAAVINSDEFFFSVLKPFASRPEQSSLVHSIAKEKGEDRFLTLLLIEMAAKLQPRGTVEYFPEASCTTNVPTDSASFISQRYRWTSSTYACLLRTPIASMGLGVGLSWLIDSLNSLFFLAFTLHFYFAIVFELAPAIANWEALQPVLVGEVLMLLLCVAMQAVIAFSTNREHAFGYAWSYLCRQYVFMYCFLVPLGTLWTLHNVKAWEGSRTTAADSVAVAATGGAVVSAADRFFAPAHRELRAHEQAQRRDQLAALRAEFAENDGGSAPSCEM